MSHVIIPNGGPGVEYRVVVGFPGYAVGNDGSVWCSLPLRRSPASTGWRNLVHCRKDTGYAVVTLHYRANGRSRRKVKKVHSIVLEAFVGPCPPGQQCRHGDGDRMNPRLDNLSWGTQAENEADKLRHGTRLRGSKAGSKLKEEDVLAIRDLLLAGEHQDSIASQFGVSPGCIEHISVGTTWAWLTGGGVTVSVETVRRKRTLAGSSLNMEQAKQVKEMLRRGEAQTVVARHFGVAKQLVWRIAHGRTWGWL